MEYAIVDIETTGSYAGDNGITEIAIIVHNGEHVLEKFETLVNPGTIIPYHIQTLTGIDNDMVAHAPSFNDIAKTVYAILQKRVFVAHNVNFDYSFINQELKKAGYDWKAPKLCTVRLSRKIFPNLASYSLGKLCQNLEIPIHHRHRAMGDVEATVTLFERLLKNDTESIIATTLKNTKEHRLPTHINQEDFLRLPESAGIYLFKNKSDKIVYVGKAVNIKKRVLTHFSGNNTSQKRQSFINDVYRIDYQESGTELMALLMECKMIKQHWPIHNQALKKFEPKFGLFEYEDQKGYKRLLVSTFNKQAKAIQYFERATEANQLLLKLMNEYQLSPKLCYFYSVRPEQKIAVDYTNIVAVKEYNDQVNQALDSVILQRNTFLLIDQGRCLDEKSYIYFKDDQLAAFGFITIDNQNTEIEDIISEKDKCISNYYMNTLVLQYAERFPSKVHKKNIKYNL
ncbi:DNA polymerase-3 subunit epsilon [Sphingobacterium nematocida]|uniref:DNA polymerase-3 subunit epsilon n=1 Tax=Sphingobacterium nematocida TaxID=1513896 RepID=A0A1T5C0B2_9SPHI|nr:exonuclease domain-containing protein [Sphingobacterium nematocida]SKB52864.1 DNA polymerase-3 subunit epsilon [Sphingobacterium nematocida]